jgi:hypothetical protein
VDGSGANTERYISPRRRPQLKAEQPMRTATVADKFKYKVATVIWNDAVHYSGLNEDNVVVHSPVTTYTTGWLLKQDESGITLCLEYDAEDVWQEETFIPAGMIKKVKIWR